jgi:hypothetical protein
MRPFVVPLVAALAAVSAADVVSTNHALASGADIVEANPLAAASMILLGSAWWLPKAGLVLFAALIAPKIRRRWPLAAVVAIYAAVVANNLMVAP